MKIRSAWLFCLITFASAASVGAQLLPAAEVRRVLEAQVAAWNHHDLDVFLGTYWHSPELTFFSGGNELDGWDAARDRYRNRYQSQGRSMGQLDFSDLRIEMLAPDAAFVRGRWHLVLPDGKQPHGLFTLILRKFSGRWKIVHDHTSEAE